MCLAVPMRVLFKDGSKGKVVLNDIEMEVALDLTPDAIPGDYVIVHAGFAIQKLSSEEAEETLLIFERLEKSWEAQS
jgi:hydrogenase expression/formation protein HypC